MNKKNNRIVILTIIASSLFAFSCKDGPPSGRPDYPVTKTVDVVDTLHGVTVADPYRWLENTDDTEVQAWTDAQNQLTRSYLDKISQREKIKARLAELWDYPSQGLPYKRDKRLFFEKNEGLQDHDVLCTVEKIGDEPEVIIDPNAWSEDGTTAMDWWMPSVDGDYIAYGKSESGAERGILHILNVVTGEELSETIPDTRYPDICWLKDNSGFYYDRFPAPGTVPPGDESYYNKIYFHKLGDDPANDKLIYSRTDIKELSFGCQLSSDEKYLILYDYLGSSRKVEVRYIDLQNRGKPKDIITGFNFYYYGEAIGDTLYLRTNEDAPNYKIIAVDLNEPDRTNWTEIIPESEDLLQSFKVINESLVIKYLHKASNEIEIFNTSGNLMRQLQLPTLGTVRQITGRWNDDRMFYSFYSFTYPITHFMHKPKLNKGEEFYQAPVKVDTRGYVTHQFTYESKDKTPVTMFVVHKSDLAFDGSNPVYMTGYGGFSSNQTPYFSSSLHIWLENGGIYCLPNLRGGAEYGEKWHQGGMLENKQNTFDDFIAAAQWLIKKGYTNPDKIAISGGSNGGLLVGAAAVQRPDLFEAVISKMPLLDMLRFHKFLMARYWISEYGDPDDPEQFEYMKTWSPYHNIKQNTDYPAILLRGGETDMRTHPLHARKMAAALQAATSSDAPILLDIERKTGHGWGMPTNLLLEKKADDYAFIFRQLGMEVKGE